MPNVKNNASAQETRRRLMIAAGQIFAERGLHAATIKQITDRAGVNTAAINYHFRDKFELYSAVIRHIVDSDAPHLIPETLGAGPAPERLRQFIRHFMHHILSRDTEAWKRLLLSRELAQPTTSFDYIIRGFAAPLHAILKPQIRELLGPAASDQNVDLALASILGQCLFYPRHREAITKTQPALAALAAHDHQRIADHITDMTLAGLAAQRHRRREPLTPPFPAP